MKQGTTVSIDNRPTKKRKTDLNSREIIRCISTIYQKYLDEQGNITPYEIDVIRNFVTNQNLLETVYNAIPEKLLNTAIVIAQEDSKLLKALLSNETIVNKINVHQVTSRTRNDQVTSAFNLAYLRSQRGHSKALLMLFEKLPYTKIMNDSLDNDIKEIVNKRLFKLALVLPKANKILPYLLQQRLFTDRITRKLDKSSESFRFMLEDAMDMIGSCTALFEFIFQQTDTLQRCIAVIKEDKAIIYPILNSAAQCANKGRVDILSNILDIDLLFNIKLKNKILPKNQNDLFRKLALCRDQDSLLATKINKYLTSQDVDMDKLNAQQQQLRLQNIIECGKIDDLDRIIKTENVDLDSISSISLAIINAGKAAENQGVFSLEYQNALQIIQLLLQNGANLEKKHMGTLPLFNAIATDLKCNTYLTRLLLEFRGTLGEKININNSCTPFSEDMEYEFLDENEIKLYSKLFLMMTPMHFCLIVPKFLNMIYQNIIIDKNHWRELIQTLLAHKPDLNLKNGNNKSVRDLLDSFELAGEQENKFSMEKLLERKIKEMSELDPLLFNFDASIDSELNYAGLSNSNSSRSTESSSDYSINEDYENRFHEFSQSAEEVIFSKYEEIFRELDDDTEHTHEQNLHLKKAVAGLNNDFNLLFNTIDALSTEDYSLIDDPKIARMRPKLPADIIANIASLAFCPAYKSSCQLEKDTIKLHDQQWESPSKIASDKGNFHKYHEKINKANRK